MKSAKKIIGILVFAVLIVLGSTYNQHVHADDALPLPLSYKEFKSNS